MFITSAKSTVRLCAADQAGVGAEQCYNPAVRRRLLNLLTALSLLLCAAVVVLSVRSRGHAPVADVWYWPGQTRHFVESLDGSLCFGQQVDAFSSESVCVPFYMPLAATAVLPVVLFVLRARERRGRRVGGFDVVPPADRYDAA